jgi:uncharacterized protein YjbJ (UPF0337 family)
MLQNQQLEISGKREGNSIMNWDEVEGNWKQLKGAVKEKWGKLTDDDLDMIAGNRDKLAGRLQECYGLHKQLAELQCDEWCNAAERIIERDGQRSKVGVAQGKKTSIQ